MAPLPPDSTPRFKIEYTNFSRQHTLNIRSSSSPGAVGVQIDDFFTAIGNLLESTIIGTVSYAPSGSSVFNPVTTGAEGNAYGSPGGSSEAEAWFVGFLGRTSGGKRARLFVFGAKFLAADYRWAPGEEVAVDNAISVLQAQSPGWTAIDGLVPVWKNYANAKANDRIVRDMR